MKKIWLFITLCALSLDSVAKESYETAFKKGCEYFAQRNYHKAEFEFKKCLELNAHCFQAYYNLGLICETQKDPEAAINYFIKALTINPQYTKPLKNVAKLCFETGKKKQAKEYYTQVLQHDAEYAPAHHHLGKIYQEETLHDLCIYHLEKARAGDPNNARILLDLANAKNMMNETEQALELYLILDRMLPNNPSVIYNIAYTLKKLGRLKDAIPYYHKTLQIRPDNADAHFGYGLALLITEQWEQGWKEYEWRWIKNGSSTLATFNKPMWDGSDLHGKRIFMIAEQGLGDTFQFIRYVKIAKEMGGTTIVAMQKPLMSYMKHCPYIDILISTQDPPPEFDVYAPLVSCPMIFNVLPDTVPADIPYLHADENLTTKWREKLSKDKKFKIGICWQGNPNYSTHFLRLAVAAKSMPLFYFVQLFDIPGTSFYCLQIKTGTEQLNDLSPDARAKLTIFDDTFDKTHGSFMDSAAVVKNLDLFITIDTSMGHFAAALGTPTWVILPEPPDWRWMLDRPDTPWYPNMKLFRQPTPGDWQTPIDAIAAELMTILDMQR